MLHYTCDACGKTITPQERIAVSIRSTKQVEKGRVNIGGTKRVSGTTMVNEFLYLDLCAECHSTIIDPISRIARTTQGDAKQDDGGSCK